MANQTGYFGFSPAQTGSASMWNGKLTPYKIVNGYGTNIFKGDPVKLVKTTNVGYVNSMAASGSAILGIFWGCRYYDTVQQKYVWFNMYSTTASPPSGVDIDCFVIDDPLVEFDVRVSGTAITNVHVGVNGDVNLGSGVTATGLSGAYLDYTTLATTSTLPFRVTGFWPPVQNGVGNDPTLANPIVRVKMNTSQLLSATGI